MIRDPRLHLDASSRRYGEKARDAQLQLDASVSASAWWAMLPPLREATIARARGISVPISPFPEAGDLRFRDAFETLIAQLRKQENQPSDGLAYAVLAQRLAEDLGLHTPERVEEWHAITATFRNSRCWGRFVEAIPTALVQAKAQDLTTELRDAPRCFDSFAPVRDNWPGVERSLSEKRTQYDRRSWIESIEQTADATAASAELSLYSELLARLGATAWLTWVMNLPHAVCSTVAINDVHDLDFLESLIACCVEWHGSAEVAEIVLTLLVHRAIDLWEQIGRSLQRAVATMYPLDDELRAEYEALLAHWSTVELMARVTKLVGSLLANERGREVALVTLSGLNVHKRESNGVEELPVRSEVRTQLIAGLAVSHADYSVNVLGDGKTTSALLAGAALTAHTPSESQRQTVLRGYLNWLARPEFFWSAPLDGDTLRLVDELAKIIAETNSPSGEIRVLLTHVRRVPQGWRFDLEGWFDSLPRVAHVLIVAAVSAAIAFNNQRPQEAGDVADLAWDALDSLLFDAPTPVHDACVDSAVSYVWAYASKTLRDAEARVAPALARFDDIRRAISAAQNFAQNAGGLPIDAQRILRNALETREPILAVHPHVSADELARLRQLVRELTPAVDIAEGIRLPSPQV